MQRCKEGDGAKHKEEDITCQRGIAKKFDRLQSAIHVRTLVVVEESIGKHKQATGPTYLYIPESRQTRVHGNNLPRRKYGTPPPTIVFYGELEVGQCYGDACCHTQQNEEDDKQNAI